MTGIHNLRTNRITTLFLTCLVSFALATPLPIFAMRQDSQQAPSGQKSDEAASVPRTAKEHRERAEQYQKKAAEYRQEAETHRKMLAEYKKTVATNPKEVIENGYIKKMRLHCEKYIKAAEQLAREADEMASYHLMRAKELEGQ